jgi:hypothetical protein
MSHRGRRRLIYLPIFVLLSNPFLQKALKRSVRKNRVPSGDAQLVSTANAASLYKQRISLFKPVVAAVDAIGAAT